MQNEMNTQNRLFRLLLLLRRRIRSERKKRFRDDNAKKKICYTTGTRLLLDDRFKEERVDKTVNDSLVVLCLFFFSSS